MTGGAVGLAIAMVLGPRIGKFNKDGSANTIPGHNFPLGALGTIILFFGWFGFNPGSALGLVTAASADGSVPATLIPLNLMSLAAVNTLVAGSAGGCVAMAYMWLFGPTKKPDPGMSVNGLLAGLVAITAPCAFVDSVAAVIIGSVAGVLVCLASVWLEKAKIDDPVGAVPVHFVNGMWGVLAVGLFANGNPDTAAWNGVSTPVTGLFFGGSTQIIAQVLEAAAVAIFVFATSFALFTVLKRAGLLRSRAEDEIGGLDLPEMGSPGYVAGDISVPGGEVAEPTTLPGGATAPAS
jgi:Amt family ammonium transporter